MLTLARSKRHASFASEPQPRGSQIPSGSTRGSAAQSDPRDFSADILGIPSSGISHATKPHLASPANFSYQCSKTGGESPTKLTGRKPGFTLPSSRAKFSRAEHFETSN